MRGLLIAFLLTSTPVFAQDASPTPADTSAPGRCGPELDGQISCRSGVVYECAYTPPNSLERRSGWRWRQDILRECDATPAPADLPGGDRSGSMPSIVYAPQINGSSTQPGPVTGQTQAIQPGDAGEPPPATQPGEATGPQFLPRPGQATGLPPSTQPDPVTGQQQPLPRPGQATAQSPTYLAPWTRRR